MPAPDTSPLPADDRAFRPLQAVLVALVVAFVLGKERGLAAALVVFVWSVGVLLATLQIPERGHPWSTRRPLIETSLIVPLLFAVIAIATDLPIALCALIAVAAWPLLWLGDRRRRAVAGDPR